MKILIRTTTYYSWRGKQNVVSRLEISNSTPVDLSDYRSPRMKLTVKNDIRHSAFRFTNYGRNKGVRQFPPSFSSAFALEQG
jgi:hypothetical protein